MVDRSLILRKLSQLDTYIEQVSEYSGIGPEQYMADWKVQRIVERTLQMMIETCTDIAEHIIADSRMRVPTSYADTFSVLRENNIIDEKLSLNLEKMSKFRNIVVHQYEGVDASIVVLILQEHIKDFDEFKEAVLRFLGRGS